MFKGKMQSSKDQNVDMWYLEGLWFSYMIFINEQILITFSGNIDNGPGLVIIKTTDGYFLGCSGSDQRPRDFDHNVTYYAM